MNQNEIYVFIEEDKHSESSLNGGDKPEDPEEVKLDERIKSTAENESCVAMVDEEVIKEIESASDGEKSKSETDNEDYFLSRGYLKTKVNS